MRSITPPLINVNNFENLFTILIYKELQPISNSPKKSTVILQYKTHKSQRLKLLLAVYLQTINMRKEKLFFFTHIYSFQIYVSF